MGQKINPTGYRLGISKNWSSRWFASKKDYARLFLEDKKIIEKDISLDMLYKAKKIAIFNAMLDFIELNDYSFKL